MGLLQNLTQSIITPGRVLLVLDKAECLTPLTRCWCLYEIYIANTVEAKLQLSFSTEGANAFMANLQENQHSLAQIAIGIDFRNARATVESDREMIFRCIEERGVDTFNSFIRAKLLSSLKLIALANSRDMTRGNSL